MQFSYYFNKVLYSLSRSTRRKQRSCCSKERTFSVRNVSPGTTATFHLACRMPVSQGRFARVVAYDRRALGRDRLFAWTRVRRNQGRKVA